MPESSPPARTDSPTETSPDGHCVLNPEQRRAATYGLGDEPNAIPGPLLIIAGAGSGKTQTLASRVAELLLQGADARRILLMTFTRRAAHEMTRRAQAIVLRSQDQMAASSSGPGSSPTGAALGGLRPGRSRFAGPEPSTPSRIDCSVITPSPSVSSLRSRCSIEETPRI